MPLEITDGGLVQQDEITLWVNLLCVAVDEPHNSLCLRDNHVGKVERGIDSDEEGAVLPPTTTTHRYNYAVDKVKALANTKGLYDTALFDRLPIFQRYREFLTDDLVKSKKNSDMIVSKRRRQNGTFLITIYAPFNLSDNASLPQLTSIRGRRTLLTRFKRQRREGSPRV
jgi:hypothetical protein